MAVIVQRAKFIFIHIPKNGGTSVSRMLQPTMTSEDTLVMEGGYEDTDTRDVFPLKYNITKHAPALNFAMWMEDTGRKWSEWDSWAVIREPIERVNSLFWEVKYHGHAWAPYQAGIQWWEEFLRCRDVNDYITSGLYTPHSPLLVNRPQRWMVTTTKNVLIVRNLVDFAKLDTMPQMMMGGIEGVKVPKTNVANYKPISLSKEAEDLLREKYEQDFKMYAVIAQR
jgi:hypothetical protein